jgi:hypothetical protein
MINRAFGKRKHCFFEALNTMLCKIEQNCQSMCNAEHHPSTGCCPNPFSLKRFLADPGKEVLFAAQKSSFALGAPFPVSRNEAYTSLLFGQQRVKD